MHLMGSKAANKSANSREVRSKATGNMRNASRFIICRLDVDKKASMKSEFSAAFRVGETQN